MNHCSVVTSLCAMGCSWFINHFTAPSSPLIPASWRQEGNGMPKESSKNSKSVHGPLSTSATFYRNSEQIHLFLWKGEWRGKWIDIGVSEVFSLLALRFDVYRSLSFWCFLFVCLWGSESGEPTYWSPILQKHALTI